MSRVRDLRDYLDYLEQNGRLVHIKEPLSPLLEIPEVLRRVMNRGLGKALLFHNVRGYEEFRVAGNLFASYELLCDALGVTGLEEAGKRLFEPIARPPPLTMVDKFKSLGEVMSLGKYMPKKTGKALFAENVVEGTKARLDILPAFKVWPKDGGRYLTYPLVHIVDPVKQVVNMGVYRVMLHEDGGGVIHWQIHKRGMQAHQDAVEKGEEEIPVAIAIGSDIGTMLTGALPVPYPIDKHLFAGVVRGEGLPVYVLDNGVPVPANSEIVVEGRISLTDLRPEGPYGDHFGYYDKPDRLFPYLKVDRIWYRNDPIYFGSVTGKPPMEDVVIGKAAERIFLPSIQTLLPEVVDLYLPPYGMFQGMAFVSIRKRYPGHGKKVALALMGLGQLSLTKIFIIVDHDIRVSDINQVIWAVSSHVDPQRDVIVIQNTHADELDPSTPVPRLGSKLAIDATRKLPEEYEGKEWPEEVEVDEETRARIDEKWPKLGIE